MAKRKKDTLNEIVARLLEPYNRALQETRRIRDAAAGSRDRIRELEKEVERPPDIEALVAGEAPSLREIVSERRRFELLKSEPDERRLDLDALMFKCLGHVRREIQRRYDALAISALPHLEELDRIATELRRLSRRAELEIGGRLRSSGEVTQVASAPGLQKVWTLEQTSVVGELLYELRRRQEECAPAHGTELRG